MKRRIRAIVIAVAAVMAMTAAFASGSASARTVLCAEAAAPCATGKVQPAGKYLVTGVNNSFDSSTTFTMTKFFTNFSCKVATLSSKSTAESGSPLNAEGANALNLETCRANNAVCSQAAINNPPETIESTSGNNGVVKIGTVAEPLTISFTCGPTECAFAASGPVSYEITGETGGTPGVGRIKAATMNRTKGTETSGCDSSAPLNVTSRLSTNQISSHTYTVLCAEAAAPCATGKVQLAGKYLVTGVNNSFDSSTTFALTDFFTNFSCKVATLSSKTTAEAGSPLSAEGANALNLESCRAAGFVCSQASINNPPETIESTGGNNGVVKIGTEAQPLTISYTCGPTECAFAASGPVSYEITGETGGTPGVGRIKAATMNRTKGTETSGCDSSAPLNVTSRLSTNQISTS